MYAYKPLTRGQCVTNKKCRKALSLTARYGHLTVGDVPAFCLQSPPSTKTDGFCLLQVWLWKPHAVFEQQTGLPLFCVDTTHISCPSFLFSPVYKDSILMMGNCHFFWLNDAFSFALQEADIRIKSSVRMGQWCKIVSSQAMWNESSRQWEQTCSL